MAALWLGRRRARRVRAGFVSLLFAVATLGHRDRADRGLRRGVAGLQDVTDVTWISQLGIHYKIGVDGLNLFLIPLTALFWVGATVCSLFREWPRARNYYLMLALGETAALGGSAPRTWRCSCSSSTSCWCRSTS